MARKKNKIFSSEFGDLLNSQSGRALKRRVVGIVLLSLCGIVLLLALSSLCIVLLIVTAQLQSDVESLMSPEKGALCNNTSWFISTLENQAEQLASSEMLFFNSSPTQLNSSLEALKWDVHELVQNLASSANSMSCNNPCDCCSGDGGVAGRWTSVARLDMKNGVDRCPRGLRELTASSNSINNSNNTRRLCVIPTNTPACQAVVFSVGSQRYSRVCGRIIGYQFGSTDAFHRYDLDINDLYVDGVTLTHGSDPVHHIWTFAASARKAGNLSVSKCPCNEASRPFDFVVLSPPPSFVASDYFCDTADSGEALSPPGTSLDSMLFFGGDPLWDGASCGPSDGCCCGHNRPPWFHRALPQSTTDDIVMRVCRDEPSDDEDVGIEVVEIYIHT